MIKNKLRFWLMPGLDLFGRRRVRLSRHWEKGNRRVLDAGSGNGWFSYLAYRSGAEVVAVTNQTEQIRKAKAFYNEWLGISPEKLSFIESNLYELSKLPGRFDEIICYEVLEHIQDEHRIISQFREKLREGGVLHLCCPYAKHPRWMNESLDTRDGFGHVRAGYTYESYEKLLSAHGFEIVEKEDMGAPWLAQADIMLERLRHFFGDAVSLPLFFIMLPLVTFDPVKVKCPYSVYVKAVKKGS